MGNSRTITVITGQMAICRLPSNAPLPGWMETPVDFFSITRTRDELSIVCKEACIPVHIKCERDWSLLKVDGPLDFALTGILASLVSPLAHAGISVFAISTFDTDYLLVKSDRLEEAVNILGDFCTINMELS